MENEKLSFRKRISLCKAKVVSTLIKSKELSTLGSGSSKNGYYSLSTIMETFQPALVENDLDFDICMNDDEVIGTWIDCESDQVVDISFKLGRLSKIIEKLDKLPMMQNAIQTEGSIKTYFRRYALTAFLNLPATDEIDSANNSSGTKKPSTPAPTFKPTPTPNPKPVPAPPVPAGTPNPVTEVSVGKLTISLEDILLFENNIRERLLDTGFWNRAVIGMFNLKNINSWLKSDFDKFYGYISEIDGDNYKVSNKELISTMELKLKETDKKIQQKKGA